VNYGNLKALPSLGHRRILLHDRAGQCSGGVGKKQNTRERAENAHEQGEAEEGAAADGSGGS